MNKDDIKSSVSVREVLDLLGVRVKGRLASCPLHQDTNPSLSFGKELWKCFSCGVGGDIFTLIEKELDLNFKGALSYIAQHFGFELDNNYRPDTSFNDALNESYEELKRSIKEELQAIHENIYHMNGYRGFWMAKEYTKELINFETAEHLESQLRELEEAKYSVKRRRAVGSIS